jgi:dipeptidyl aminopeptidase/acylaminoacyl peptidase
MATGLARSADGGVDVAASESGLLAYIAGAQSNDRRELVWVDRAGRVTPIDTNWTGRLDSRVRLSPDGRSALVQRIEDIGVEGLWVKPLDRGPAMRLAQSHLSTGAWSPDGKSIAFTSFANTGEIWLGPADGSVAPHVIVRTATQSRQVEFTADGQWVVYSNNGDLFAARTRGDSTPTNLVETRAFKSNPVVSPDGHWLAYSSRESGAYQVYVRPFPDTRAGRLQISSTG